MLDKICENLKKISDSVSYDEMSGVISIYEEGITAYMTEDNIPCAEIEYEGTKYRYFFKSKEMLYSFLEGVLRKKITISCPYDRALRIDGFEDTITPLTKKKNIFRRIICTLLGLPIAAFGIMLGIFGVLFYVDPDSPKFWTDLSPLPIAVGISALGTGIIHHGWTKKPFGFPSMLSYFFGVGLVSFALSMMMITMDSSDDSVSDSIGVTFVIIIFFIIGVFLTVMSFTSSSQKNSRVLFFNRKPHDLTKAQLDLLLKNIKEQSMIETVKITTAPEKEVTITDSKFGGLPYWDPGMPYPMGVSGENMSFLAQFNMAQVPPTEKLPKEGMLQFFIDPEMNCKVIYHKHIDEKFTKELADKMNLRSNGDDILPFDREYGLEFELTKTHIGYEDISESKFIQAAANELGFKLAEDTMMSELVDEYSEGDEFTAESGHHLLGYPAFAQGDPREIEDPHNTLLFQMGSEMNKDSEILWGDYGIANFFINDDALRALDFSDVIFTWDCY